MRIAMAAIKIFSRIELILTRGGISVIEDKPRDEIKFRLYAENSIFKHDRSTDFIIHLIPQKLQ